MLTDLLSDDFRGTLTAGLPHGFGRTYEGRDAMMNEGWGAIGAHFALAPQVERLWDGGDVLIARGTYVGHAIETGRPVHAAFAHVWGFDGTPLHLRRSGHRQRRLGRGAAARCLILTAAE